MDTKDTIANALNIEPIDISNSNIVVKEPDFKDDFEYARGQMINIIEKGSEALDGILDVAGMSQHPRSYEVVATLIKTLADTNKDLLELSKRKKDLEGDSASKPTTVNNNLFVGSTAELQKLIKQSNDRTE